MSQISRAADGDPAFFAELAPDAVLHASILAIPVTGAQEVRNTIRRISGHYSEMRTEFHGVVAGRQLLQYTTRLAGGVALHAIVMVTRNIAGAIGRIEIGYYPLAATMLLAELYQAAFPGATASATAIHQGIDHE